jgi:type II secretory pathway pseudopilin PulG
VTLLEALAALVILGLAATGVAERVHAGARTAQRAEEWARAVAAAEATLEGALLAAPPDASPDADDNAAAAAPGPPARARPRVTVRPWEGAPRTVDEVAATVTLPDGTPFTLRRLVRRTAPRAP